MGSELEELRALLDRYGQKVDAEKTVFKVTTINCIDVSVPASPRVYWIETTMPVQTMPRATSAVSEKEREVRVTPPRGARLIEQKDGGLYVAYSGTEADLRKRLKQHLFNEGHPKTVKLGCKIDKEPFSLYQWRAGFVTIDSYEIRYAIELWWRLNKGWPKFCLR